MFELLDSPISGVYSIARFGVDHHGFDLAAWCFLPGGRLRLPFAAFVISEVGSCLCRSLSLRHKDMRFFSFAEVDAMRCIHFISLL